MIKNNTLETEYNHKQGKPLTDVELEILFFLCQGYSQFEVAELLYKSKNTIRNQIKSICDKLDLPSSPGVVAHWTNKKLKEKYDTTLKELLAD